jgi:hypothetical protein
VLDQPERQAQLLELSLNLSLGRHLWHFARGDEVRQDPCEQCRGRLGLMQCQPFNESLAAALPGRNQVALTIPAIRVVYAKAGTLPAAAVVEDAKAVIDHMLYWMPVQHRREGLYLASILGSEAARLRVAALQARGQWGARHFDKVMFTLPIPRFNPKTQLHKDLAAVGAEAEKAAATVELADDAHFQTARRRVREGLAAAGVSQKIDELVASLLS